GDRVPLLFVRQLLDRVTGVRDGVVAELERLGSGRAAVAVARAAVVERRGADREVEPPGVARGREHLLDLDRPGLRDVVIGAVDDAVRAERDRERTGDLRIRRARARAGRRAGDGGVAELPGAGDRRLVEGVRRGLGRGARLGVVAGGAGVGEGGAWR